MKRMVTLQLLGGNDLILLEEIAMLKRQLKKELQLQVAKSGVQND
jgi:hypothetical protein